MQVRWGEIKSGGASYGLVWSGRLGKVRFDLVLCGLLGQAWWGTARFNAVWWGGLGHGRRGWFGAIWLGPVGFFPAG